MTCNVCDKSLIDYGDGMTCRCEKVDVLKKLVDSRVVDISLSYSKAYLSCTELCDDHYGVNLSKVEVSRLISQLQDMHDVMKTK